MYLTRGRSSTNALRQELRAIKLDLVVNDEAHKLCDADRTPLPTANQSPLCRKTTSPTATPNEAATCHLSAPSSGPGAQSRPRR